MRLIIVRHGETDWNRECRYQGRMDIPLNENGRRQAHLLAKALSCEEISLIFSSPLKRALETAKVISLQKGVPIIVRDELSEIYHGEWEGLLLSEVKRKYADVFEMWKREPEKTTIPSGESLNMVLNRVKPLLAYIIDKCKDKTVLIVGHGGVNKVIFCVLLGLPLSYFWKFRQDNANLSILESLDGDRGFCLKRFNDTCHLCSPNETLEGAL